MLVPYDREALDVGGEKDVLCFEEIKEERRSQLKSRRSEGKEDEPISCNGIPEAFMVTMSFFMMCDTRVKKKGTTCQLEEGRKGKKTARLTRLDESLVVPVLVLLLEERIAVELDHLIGDSTLSERLADGFGDEDDDLEESRASVKVREEYERKGTSTHHRWKNVGESSSKLEHDNHDRNSHSSHTTETSRTEEISSNARTKKEETRSHQRAAAAPRKA